MKVTVDSKKGLKTNLRVFVDKKTIDEKIDALRDFGLDNLIIYPFTKEFSRLTAFEFVRDILVEKLKVKTLLPIVRLKPPRLGLYSVLSDSKLRLV